ncbi:hypothetical protein chiPu_0028718 [Chiloscyllium punctatum]|uniref:Uncharacterized protein n=1 Tax=Chiloscyllium punctatum TaxID=137246 RepID=A0A401TPA9_CHIPU|nr:hypothetical protein [Chiloscyllium punctatum]
MTRVGATSPGFLSAPGDGPVHVQTPLGAVERCNETLKTHSSCSHSAEFPICHGAAPKAQSGTGFLTPALSPVPGEGPFGCGVVRDGLQRFPAAEVFPVVEEHKAGCVGNADVIVRTASLTSPGGAGKLPTQQPDPLPTGSHR